MKSLIGMVLHRQPASIRGQGSDMPSVCRQVMHVNHMLGTVSRVMICALRAAVKHNLITRPLATRKRRVKSILVGSPVPRQVGRYLAQEMGQGTVLEARHR